ncbi:hypothetical protein PsorP6_010995 [Peronosclerospora sorghi]|uniref:Uncharacterized protein n=1 Tax=Peronosclerospora sorghi TaxID=230839 RepID=A0ACC0VVQ6_9STRA|nr:hypothetical protein PsorP6_010995 [Peronosclerospora sorghi]
MLAAVSLTVSTTEANEGLRYGPICGGPHGDYFSGADKVEPGTIVKEVTLNGAERVNGITIVALPPGATVPFTFHAGGYGGEPTRLKLGAGEYITSVEYHAHKHDETQHTRIFYLQLSTNKNKTIHAGQQKGDVCMDEAPYGYQLSSFCGFQGDELDMAGAIWTSVDKDPPIIAIP